LRTGLVVFISQTDSHLTPRRYPVLLINGPGAPQNGYCIIIILYNLCESIDKRLEMG
jgi:hypothetical protein